MRALHLTANCHRNWILRKDAREDDDSGVFERAGAGGDCGHGARVDELSGADDLSLAVQPLQA